MHTSPLGFGAPRAGGVIIGGIAESSGREGSISVRATVVQERCPEMVHNESPVIAHFGVITLPDGYVQ